MSISAFCVRAARLAFLAVLANFGMQLVATPSNATPPPLVATHYEQPCGVMLEFTNSTQWAFSADYRIGSEPGVPDEWTGGRITGGAYDGQKFGPRYNTVDLLPGETVTVTVQVEEVAHVRYRIWRGPENDFYVPWARVRDVRPCSEPDVTFTDNCFGTAVYLSNGEGAAVPAAYRVSPITPNVGVTLDISPGHTEMIAFGRDAGEIRLEEQVTGTVYTHTWSEPDTCAAPSPTPEATVSPEPTAQPSESPSESPAAAPGGVGGGLPNTGSSVLLLAGGGAAAAALGCVAFLTARRRRVAFTSDQD